MTTLSQSSKQLQLKEVVMPYIKDHRTHHICHMCLLAKQLREFSLHHRLLLCQQTGMYQFSKRSHLTGTSI